MLLHCVAVSSSAGSVKTCISDFKDTALTVNRCMQQDIAQASKKVYKSRTSASATLNIIITIAGVIINCMGPSPICLVFTAAVNYLVQLRIIKGV